MSGRLREIFRSRVGVAIVSVVATALIISGGTAVAISIPRNSVKSSTIKNGAIRRVDMQAGLPGQFARVAYTAGVPAITAQSGGLAVVNEPFTGAVRISFPMSMDTCAITATAYTPGTNTSVRRSTIGGGTEIVVVGFDTADATVETDFDLIAQCK